jgi:hypothetical protein
MIGEYSQCLIERINPTRSQCTITVPPELVESVYQSALRSHQASVTTYGFTKGTTPLSYIERICRSALIDHLKEFLFQAYVYPALHETIIQQRCIIFGEPTLTSIAIEPPSTAVFTFEFALCDLMARRSWRDLYFKTPGRKNYKDLDRQVETFIREEHEREKSDNQDTVSIDDWVLCAIEFGDSNNTLLMGGKGTLLWIKMADEDVDSDSRALFIGKKRGDIFSVTHCPLLTSYFSPSWNPNHTYTIKIIEHISHKAFSIDDFKNHFSLKTPRDIHSKLIEVFSFRNDVCQRREIIETTFKALRDLYILQPGSDCLEKQQAAVIKSIQNNPDYHVYKGQTTLFNQIVQALALKQLSEMGILDYLSAHEHLVLTPSDIKTYFNLLKRPRTRQFIYCDLPPTKVQGREWFIPHAAVKRQILREKTLNSILNHLTRR